MHDRNTVPLSKHFCLLKVQYTSCSPLNLVMKMPNKWFSSTMITVLNYSRACSIFSSLTGLLLNCHLNWGSDTWHQPAVKSHFWCFQMPDQKKHFDNFFIWLLFPSTLKNEYKYFDRFFFCCSLLVHATHTCSSFYTTSYQL